MTSSNNLKKIDNNHLNVNSGPQRMSSLSSYTTQTSNNVIHFNNYLSGTKVKHEKSSSSTSIQMKQQSRETLPMIPQEPSSVCDKACRICYDKEKEKDPLLIPCKCEGSMKFIHSSCLKKCIVASKLPLTEAECEICKTKYKINITQNSFLDKEKVKNFTFQSIFFIIILIGILTGFIIALFNILKSQGVLEKKYYPIYFAGTGLCSLIIAIILTFCLIKEYKNKCYVLGEKKWEILNYENPELLMNNYIDMPNSDVTKDNISKNAYVMSNCHRQV